MGVGFNLIGFPIPILVTVGLLGYFFITKSTVPLKILRVIWLLTVILIVTGRIADYFRKPIRLTKSDIIGEYRIDTNIFGGPNANWQYDHYKFTITSTDSIFFYVTNNGTIIKTIKEKILYSSGPPDVWKVQGAATRYHVIKYPPTLYRGHYKFYYVFKSDHYGNMFFRKV